MTIKEFENYISDKYKRIALSRTEAAEELKLSVNGLINFAKDGKIKSFRAGNREMFVAGDIAEFMGLRA